VVDEPDTGHNAHNNAVVCRVPRFAIRAALEVNLLITSAVCLLLSKRFRLPPHRHRLRAQQHALLLPATVATSRTCYFKLTVEQGLSGGKAFA
jgi:hypothetical protein